MTTQPEDNVQQKTSYGLGEVKESFLTKGSCNDPTKLKELQSLKERFSGSLLEFDQNLIDIVLNPKPKFVFVGRSGVGKTTFINALIKQLTGHDVKLPTGKSRTTLCPFAFKFIPSNGSEVQVEVEAEDVNVVVNSYLESAALESALSESASLESKLSKTLKMKKSSLESTKFVEERIAVNNLLVHLP
jgi:ATPase subunit of ABC transporter with duplicated ATPase domains